MNDGLPDLPNYVHRAPYYTPATACATNHKTGMAFVAHVVNAPDQYCVFTKVNPATKECTEVHKLYARDSRAVLLAQGADPALMNGKYGNVAISVIGDDLFLAIEMRVNNVNTPLWAILKGKAI